MGGGQLDICTPNQKIGGGTCPSHPPGSTPLVSLRFIKNYGLVILDKLLKVTKLYQLNCSYYEYHHVPQNLLNFLGNVHTTTAVCQCFARDISGSSCQVLRSKLKDSTDFSSA